MKTHRIAVLVGSLRRDSLNRKIAESIASFHDRLDCHFIEIGDLPLYNPDLEGAEAPPAWLRFRNEVRDMDGVLFVTPEYNRSMPGSIKNAIDVGSRPYGQSVFSKKPGGIVTASPGGIGGFGANHAIRQCCVFLDMPMMQQPETYLGGVSDDSFGEDGLVKDGTLKDFLKTIAHAYANWCDIIEGGRAKLA
nr:NADPH-dependent FMN reductase [uncultured Sphingomonas sp.]